MPIQFRLSASALGGTANFQKAFSDIYGDVEEASTEAMDKLATQIKNDGRQNIAAGGFGLRWQRTWRVDRYPKGRKSADAAVFAYHKILYADVFEFGKRVEGKPFLYMPTKNAPNKIGRLNTTPSRFAREIAPLESFTFNGRPMLVANYRRGRGRRKKGARKTNIIFAGVKSIQQKKRFDLYGVCDRASKLIANFYFGAIESRN